MMYTIISNLLEDPDFKAKVEFKTKQYKPNEKILIQGQEHRGVYLIKSGAVRITVTAVLKEDNSLRPGVADLGPGDLFGEFGLFDDLPASADVTSINEAELIEINIPTFRTFLEENPAIGYKVYFEVIGTLIKRLRHADQVIYNIYTWGIKAHKLDKYLE